MTARIRHDAVQFGALYTNCKNNPLHGYKLGYVCNGHMTPAQFIRANGIELIEEQTEMTGVEEYGRVIYELV